MIGFRGIASSSHPVSGAEGNPAQTHQDDRGPFDGELLDLYVALLIVVPAGCFLRALLS